MINEYMLPKTVEEALDALQQNNAKVIAGGTDLMIDLKDGKADHEILVDVTKIDEIKTLKESDGYVVVGAGVTHQELTESPLIHDKAKVLADACGTVGSLQVRNTATLAGNVVNAQPAADGAVALVALGAEVKVVDQNGEAYELVENLYEGLRKSKVDSSRQLVTEIKFPALIADQGSAYIRWAKREALALPMLSVGAVVSMKGEEIEWIRISMGPVDIKPLRALEAEAVLKGKKPTEELINEAACKAAEQANPRDSKIRGSRECRNSVLVNLVKRGIKEAMANVQ